MDVDTKDARAFEGAIARIWRGATREEDAAGYQQALRSDLREVRATEGNVGVVILQRKQDGRTEFLFVSLWESMDAVVGFAGHDVDRAVYFQDDARVLLELTLRVDHFEIVASELDRR